VPFQLPKIYPITDTRISGLTHAEQVESLIDAGAKLIQIRDKHTSTREFYESALAAVGLAHARGAMVIVNDRVDVAVAVAADGVHLGQKDLPVAQARLLLGRRAIIGLSTHNGEQLTRAIDLPLDYVALGPVFGTSTKADAEPVVGLDGVTRARELAGELPLVAIGGINADNLPLVFAAGADSAAVISGLWTHSGNRSIGDLLNSMG
jgi:thiamine-phosphate pyrophosphorylase